MVKPSGVFFGVNRGFIVTRPKTKTRNLKPSLRKGRLGMRVKTVREIVREVCGFSPYERKTMELIRAGESKKDKKARKILRHKLGTQRRAKVKFAELDSIIQAQKRKA